MAPTGRTPCFVLLGGSGCAFLPLIGFTLVRAEGCTSQEFDLSAYSIPVRGTCVLREVRAYVIQSCGLTRNSSQHIGVQRVEEGREGTRVQGTEDTKQNLRCYPSISTGGGYGGELNQVQLRTNITSAGSIL